MNVINVMKCYGSCYVNVNQGVISKKKALPHLKQDIYI